MFVARVAGHDIFIACVAGDDIFIARGDREYNIFVREGSHM